MRPKPDGRRAQIMDVVGNIERHKALPDTPQKWSLQARKDEDSEGGVAPVITCRGAVSLDLEGYISDDAGDAPEGYEREELDYDPPPRNCFPAEGVDPDGCGTISPSGRHVCECGLPFRKVCLAAPDGCGSPRSVKDWHGADREYRPGACDECCRLAKVDAQQKRAAQQKAAAADLPGLEWQETRKGNGWTLLLAPSPKPDNSYYARIWVGHKRGGWGAAMIPFEAVNGESQALRQLRREAASWRFPRYMDEDEVLERALQLLARWSASDPIRGRQALGVVCQGCACRFRSTDFPTCYPCSQAGRAAAQAAETHDRRPAPAPGDGRCPARAASAASGSEPPAAD